MRRYFKLLLLVLSAAALWGISYQLHDIVATSLAIACSVLIVYLLVFSILQLVQIKVAKCTITVLGDANGRLLSKAALIARLELTDIKIAPTFVSKLVLGWEHPGAMIKPIILNGTPNESIFLPISFPHRGIWRCIAVELAYSDPLQIVEIRQRIPLNISITICPSGHDSELREVISSASRPGDAAQSIHQRSGDLFEMKQYDPAQGVRTILWRVFAKRGELMSRSPEAAITPEGFTACYAIIRPKQDTLATKIIDYTARLQSSGISVAFSCTGNYRAPVTNATEIEESLISAVWNPPTPNHDELSKLLLTSRSFGELTQVVVFFSAKDADPSIVDTFFAALVFLEQQQIRPILALDIPEDQNSPLALQILSKITAKDYSLLEL